MCCVSRVSCMSCICCLSCLCNVCHFLLLVLCVPCVLCVPSVPCVPCPRYVQCVPCGLLVPSVPSVACELCVCCMLHVRRGYRTCCVCRLVPFRGRHLTGLLSFCRGLCSLMARLMLLCRAVGIKSTSTFYCSPALGQMKTPPTP